jgi:hypothetical protein
MIMINKKDQRNMEDFKYLIDSRKLSSKEKKDKGEAILKAREERYKDRSENEIKSLKLLQLKYQMEDYLTEVRCGSEPAFPKFLSQYIAILYAKRKNFASDIDIKPITLSHIINRHREPKDSFIRSLILHSEKSFENVCAFRKELWLQVYYQDKICHFMLSTQKEEKSEKKHVRGKLMN